MKVKRTALGTLAITAIGLLVICACSKKRDNADPEESGEVYTEPLVTAVGLPAGVIVTKTIGPEGGSLKSSDGSLQLQIPAGALSASTEIGIQPISNTTPLGMGTGYRLTPHGTTFTKPVKLTFYYQPDSVGYGGGDFLWAATQREDGVWQGMRKSTVDTIAHTVTVETPHFSDYTIGKFIDLKLNPVSTVLEVNKSIGLVLLGFYFDGSGLEDELMPLAKPSNLANTTPEQKLIAATEKYVDFNVEGWQLDGVNAPLNNGKGSLTGSGNAAQYTAPASVPAENTVAVAVKLSCTEAKQRREMMLISHITIVDKNYLILRIDGQTYYYKSWEDMSGTLPENFTMALCGLDDSEHTLNIACYYSAAGRSYNSFNLSIGDPEVASIGLGCRRVFPNTHDEVNFVKQLSTDDHALINEYILSEDNGQGCHAEDKCSNFEVVLTEYKGTAFSTVVGRFSGDLREDDTDYYFNCKTPPAHQVSGEFRLTLLTASN